ncbi:MAG: hypothetical protein LC808_34230 [Actinobacteria bacterium]|nr:hypothetical protein [Actinomycetota bacterium]
MRRRHQATWPPTPGDRAGGRPLVHREPDGATELFTAIPTGALSLPGAACRRRAPLFNDRHDGESAEQ